jgi:hypothetical protein
MRFQFRNVMVTLIALVAAGLLAAAARAAAPSNTAPPTISGTLQQGKPLAANNGTWTNAPSSFFYRWQRCGADGTGCVNIDNATQKTYALRGPDVDHTVRVVVTASNADGQTAANSEVTDVVSSKTAPNNIARPMISGTAQAGEELTANRGTWTGGVRSYAYQWQRCDSTGAGCGDMVGATGNTYGVRSADVTHRMRVVVTATNLAGSASANSDTTAVVRAAAGPPPPPPTAANHRPTIAILSVRFAGARVYVRFRACDDSRRNLNITERDSKRGVASYTRRFRTLVPPRPCAALTRSWLPAPRFRHGRYTLTLWARDYAGLTSRPASRTFFR